MRIQNTDLFFNVVKLRTRMTRFSLPTLLWLGAAFILIVYGLLAFNAGTKLSPVISSSTEGASAIERVIEEAEYGPLIKSPEYIEQYLPSWLDLVAELGSHQYAYGRDSLMSTEKHYHAMPKTERYVLSTHMMLGLVIMAAGVFQFIPAFRRQFRLAHRLLGVLYVGAAMASMSMSSYYLFVTKISDVYSTWFFYWGLWILVVVSVSGMTIAGYSILKRDITRHMGWQAIAFGAFLTAPIQRFLWIGLGPISGESSFNEMNIAVNISLLAIASLCGYLIFVANRAASPLKRSKVQTAADNAATPPLQTAVKLTAGSMLLFMAYFYFVSGGFLSSPTIMQLMPVSAASMHDTIMAPLSTSLLVIAAAVIVSLGVKLLLSSSEHFEKNHFLVKPIFVAALVAGLILCNWGYQLGLPTHEKVVAGAYYMTTGLFTLAFALYLGVSYLKANIGLVRESLFFVILLAVSPALQFIALFITSWMAFVPDPYRLEGHGYQLAAAFALATPILIPFLVAIYSRYTNRFSIH
ncbi:DUF2306 domain-containing protein [Veronia pacifica]|uniref:DUF2306 domain-containing protein n=1 Tax=Veronia pacifica TaxID=1080227 RepID=A0A1C3E9E5_9GAMM|nr:DUF2306 domain-containing protein [Veronia pacifica]ODA29897.1 hypothetical protein A8L45_21300 [Veronia pacifica]